MFACVIVLKYETTRLPKIIVSSVIRSAHQGESHGGVYLVDMETSTFDQVIDWNDCSINWEGRGADRGLRGIAFHEGHIFLAASDEIFVYDQSFNLLESFRNRYLKHCHEIFIANNTLFLTSTGFDSILAFDLVTKAFVRGYCLRLNANNHNLFYSIFDPNGDYGPQAGDTIHVNSVYSRDGLLFMSGLCLPNLLYIDQEKLYSFATIPTGSHNARPFREGVLLNDTVSERVAYLDKTGAIIDSWPVLRYDEAMLKMGHLPKDHARQAFARGLCVSDDDVIIGGSSPAAIAAYRLGNPAALKMVNLTMDVRNSVHGLEIWPF